MWPGAGKRGVEGVLGLLADDMRRMMALLGRHSAAELGANVVRWRDRGPCIAC